MAAAIGRSWSHVVARSGPVSPLSSDPQRAARQLEALAAGRQSFRPPPVGNARALVHAGHSTVAIGPFAKVYQEAFFNALTTDSPLRFDSTFTYYVALASKAFARLDQVCAWLDLHGADWNGKGVQAAFEQELRLRSECVQHLQRLQLAPEEVDLRALVEDLRERVTAAAAAAAAAGMGSTRVELVGPSMEGVADGDE